MSLLKIYNDQVSVLDAAQDRIRIAFDNFEKLYIAYSGGKDSTVMFHLIMDEAIKRNRRVGVLYVDLEAQYDLTIEHSQKLFKQYQDYIDLHWVCLPISLRNAVSNFQPRWLCWDPDNKDRWVRDIPKFDGVVSDPDYYPFFVPGYEFEEFVPEFGKWYSEGQSTACFVGIRTDESLNRFRTIASNKKERFNDYPWTTLIEDGSNVYNVYPIYDWKTSDLWYYHAQNQEHAYNPVYDYMFRAGLTPAQMRLCQPYGDDQKKGLWLYHIIEPQKWGKILARVAGTTSGALYAKESGNITGARTITKPDNMTWKEYAKIILQSLPESTTEHYLKKIKVFNLWWVSRGYGEGIPDEAPARLEAKRVVPSWRRVCKALLRNDYWCKGLGFTQPKSEAYAKYLQIKKRNKKLAEQEVSDEADS